MTKKIETNLCMPKSVVLKGAALDIGALGFKITQSMLQTTRIDLVPGSKHNIVFEPELQVVVFSNGDRQIFVPASSVVQMEIV